MARTVTLAVRWHWTGRDNTEVEWITRSARQHTGWESVQYKGQRYVLRGGIRTEYWINLYKPIKGRQ